MGANSRLEVSLKSFLKASTRLS